LTEYSRWFGASWATILPLESASACLCICWAVQSICSLSPAYSMASVQTVGTTSKPVPPRKQPCSSSLARSKLCSMWGLLLCPSLTPHTYPFWLQILQTKPHSPPSGLPLILSLGCSQYVWQESSCTVTEWTCCRDSRVWLDSQQVWLWDRPHSSFTLSMKCSWSKLWTTSTDGASTKATSMFSNRAWWNAWPTCLESNSGTCPPPSTSSETIWTLVSVRAWNPIWKITQI